MDQKSTDFRDCDVPKAYQLHRGRRGLIVPAARRAVLDHHRRYPFLYQQELAHFLLDEWGITVSKMVISRILKEERITHKKAERYGPQSVPLRTRWQADMHYMTAEQLVFVDEVLFKEQSCWRASAYAAIGDPAR